MKNIEELAQALVSVCNQRDPKHRAETERYLWAPDGEGLIVHDCEFAEF